MATKKTTEKPTLKPNQRKILEAMKDGKDYTYGEVRQATGIQRGLTRLMAAETTKGTTYPDSLEGMGLITSKDAQEDKGRASFVFAITAKGKKAL